MKTNNKSNKYDGQFSLQETHYTTHVSNSSNTKLYLRK